jgi:hydrogenase expression/formation protein HypC
MCLAVPGKIVSIINNEPLIRTGLVAFGQIEREVNLAFIPESEEGMYVIVHAGIAISTLTDAEAMRTLSYLDGLQNKVIP